MEQHMMHLLAHYGYFGLFIALSGGIIGLPIPDEVLLTFTGYLIHKGKMSFVLSLLFAFIGALTGISLSFLLGTKLGYPFLKRWGPKFHINEEKIVKTRRLFIKYGAFVLIIGYFVPGVRHIAAYLAGMSKLSFHKFSFYAYTGAFIWVTTFITTGFSLGDHWVKIKHYMHHFSLGFFLILLILIVLFARLYYKKLVKSR